MRIEKIRFKNINSLKGEHVVDFSKAPLLDAGIFAIIGPTGSGKSTLLDVITLALFNRIPRFSKSISKNEIQGNGSVMTHYTDEAYASIEYTTSNGSYISEWKVGKARTGNLKDHEMHIFNKQEGKYLGLKKSEVPTKNEELIGLNYDQFAKSIILSQGQFSKFLKADKHERGKLLEKITGTEIYRKIGERIYEKYSQFKKSIESQESNFEFIEVLQKEERDTIELAIKENVSVIKNLEKSISGLSRNAQIKGQIKVLKERKEDVKQKLAQLEEQKKVIELSINKLTQHENTSPLRGDIALYIEGKKKLNILGSRIKDISEDINHNSKELEKAITNMSTLVQQVVNENNFRSIMQTFEKEINELVFERNSVITEGKQIRNKIKEKCESSAYQIAESISKEKNADVALYTITNSATQLKGKIQQAELYLDSKTSEIIERIKVKNNESKLITEVLRYTKDLERIKHEYTSLSKSAVDLEKTIKTTNPLLEEKRILLNNLKSHFKQTQKNKENSLALFKLNDYRNNLIEGDQCPLCGSLDHPLAGHREKEGSHFDQELEKTENGISIEEKEVKRLDLLIVKANTQLKTISEQKDKLENLKSENEKWFLDHDVHPQDQSILENRIKAIEADITLLNEGREALEKYKWLSDIKLEFDALLKVTKRYSELNTTIKSKYKGEDVTTDCNRLQDEFTKYAEGLKNNKNTLKVIQEELDKETSIVTTVEKDLLPKIITLGFNKIEDVQQSFLTEAQVQTLKLEKENFDKNNISRNSELKSINKEILELEKSDKKSDLSLEALQEKLVILENDKSVLLTQNGANQNKISKDDESIKKLNALHKKLDKQKLEFEKWSLLNQMIGDRTGSKFANYAQNITLQTLLVHANNRMKSLFNRYLLAMPKSLGELVIIDTYQGNTERAVSTLSGGETFMVSLALALSLSDMASKNVALESLFIDEGFSTLDPEMLELAMNTLDKIQSESQKTVGIISHVESLKERIAVQIQLKRNAQGFSSIQIIS